MSHTQVLKKVHAHIDKHFAEHLVRIQEYVRQPSISADGTGMKETADMTRAFVEELGGTSKIVQTDGWPVVYGELNADAPKTLIIYGMYDVQPVEEEKNKWIVPPFGGKIVSIKPFGKCLVNRGAINTKAPLRAFFNVCQSILAVEGKLPVNLIFVVEGEEELGSVHMPQFVEKYQRKLQKANAVFFPLPQEDTQGKVILPLGVKGIIYMDLICQGGKWGGPTKRGIHSSFHACIDSPVWRLLWALAELKTPDGKITVEDFYENASPPSDEEEQLLKRLTKTFDEESWRIEHEVSRFTDDLRGVELLKRYAYTPSMNIDGLISGYTDEGTKTVLPHWAKAKIDIRLVPHMKTDEIVKKVKTHLRRKGYGDIKVKLHDCYMWAQISVREKCVQAMIRAYRQLGYEPEIWPRLAGSAPFYVFNQPPLSLPFVIGGLGHGGRMHSPNEYFVVKGIKNNEKSVATFLYEYAH